jgi:hypothetical protein
MEVDLLAGGSLKVALQIESANVKGRATRNNKTLPPILT